MGRGFLPKMMTAAHAFEAYLPWLTGGNVMKIGGERDGGYAKPIRRPPLYTINAMIQATTVV